jgi:DNA-binding response OmpR family regulator
VKKILLVDDDVKIRKIYRAALEMEGYLVIEIGDWEMATIELLRNHDTDLVLLDINMPSVSGDVVYDVIRLYNPKIRVVMFSVCSVDEQKRLVGRADGYFDKSDGVDTLLNLVRTVLTRPCVAQASQS